MQEIVDNYILLHMLYYGAMYDGECYKNCAENELTAVFRRVRNIAKVDY